MYTYYIEKEDKIVLYSSKKANLEKALECMPQYVDLKINRTSKGIVEFEGKFYFEDDEEYLALKRAKEEEDLGNLHMTRGDVFEALILAKQKTKADVRQLIENYEGLTDLEKALYLNRFDEALEFYRKYPAIDLIGAALEISKEQMDNFFRTKDWHALVTEG